MSLPINIDLLDPEQFIKERNIQEVTSNLITEPSSDRLHPEGLYSEEIFGPVTSSERMILFGFINLNTELFHPKIYRLFLKLRRFFVSIMEGEVYAIWDEKAKQFVKASEDDENADTGFAFFMKHIPDHEFEETESIPAQNRIKVFNKYRNNLTIRKHLVIPAGLRDYEVESAGKGSSEEINKHYNALLNYSRAVTSSQGNDPMYDSIRMAMQKKVYQIFEYLENIMAGPKGGKRGFLQDKYGKRNLALGARNVISAAQFSGSDPGDERFHDVDNTKVPLVVVNSTFQPLIVYYLRHLFLNYVITSQQEQASVINPDTYKVEFQEIDDNQKNLYTTSDGADRLVNLFKNVHFRNKPAGILNKNNKLFYLALVYDDGNIVTTVQNINEFKEAYQSVFNSEPDMNNLRPMTYVEMFYISAIFATKGKFMTIKRDPSIDLGNVYVSKVYVMTTQKSRKIKFYQLTEGEQEEPAIFPEYPIPGEDYIDSTILHPSRLSGLDGDYDGDQTMNNGIMNEASLEEVRNYVDSKQHILNPGGSLATSISTDVTKLVFYNLSLME